MNITDILKPMLTPFLKFKVNFSVDDRQFYGGEPFAVISSHSTRVDFLFLIAAFKKYNLKTLAQSHNFAVKGLRYFAKKGGSIIKSQVNGDIYAIKALKRETDNKNNVLIFPAGMSSHCGKSFEIYPNIAKLVRLLNCNIVTCRIDGGYLSVPPYKNGMRKGNVKLTIKNIIDKENISKLSNTEMFNLINDEISFDDIEYQRINKIDLGRNRLGKLDRILWRCPKCNDNFTIVADKKANTLTCSHCGYSVYFDKYGFFESNSREEVVFDNIRDWYQSQIAAIKEYKNQKTEFSIKVERRKIDLNKAKSYKMEEGNLTWNNEKGLIFSNAEEEICYLSSKSKNITQINLEELYVVEGDFEILFRPYEKNKLLTLFWLIRL